MRFTTVQVTLLLIGIASADLARKPLGIDNSRLMARQTQVCTKATTCSQCFGPGNVLCSRNSCFNPSAGEQCCANGNYCIGPDTSCCRSMGGAGITGSDGVPGSTAAVSSSAVLSSTRSTASSSVAGTTPTPSAAATSGGASGGVSRTATSSTPTTSRVAAATTNAGATGAIGSFAAAVVGIAGLVLL